MTLTVDALCLERSLDKNIRTHEAEEENLMLNKLALYFIKKQKAEKVRHQSKRRFLIFVIMLLVVIMFVMVWQVLQVWNVSEPECMPQSPSLDILDECIKLRAFSWELNSY